MPSSYPTEGLDSGLATNLPADDAASFFSLQRGGGGDPSGDSVRYTPADDPFGREMVPADDD
jgi:hypothetical protein